MATLVNFPIEGSVVSNNVAQDRFSLVVNTVGNLTFPVGQYLFYSKNGSLWYKFKNLSNWSIEHLYIVGGSQSNTKFDNNGYPITSYVDSKSNVKLHYYLNNNVQNMTLAKNSSLPTVVVGSQDTFVFFVPNSYMGTINYVQQIDSFRLIKPYSINVPGKITSMQIQAISGGNFIFSFGSTVLEPNLNNTHQIYLSISNPPIKSNNVSINSNVNFISPGIPAYFNLESYVTFNNTHYDFPAKVSFNNVNYDNIAYVNFQLNQVNVHATINFINQYLSFPANVSLITPYFNLSSEVNFLNNNYNLPAVVNFIVSGG